MSERSCRAAASAIVLLVFSACAPVVDTPPPAATTAGSSTGAGGAGGAASSVSASSAVSSAVSTTTGAGAGGMGGASTSSVSSSSVSSSSVSSSSAASVSSSSAASVSSSSGASVGAGGGGGAGGAGGAGGGPLVACTILASTVIDQRPLNNLVSTTTAGALVFAYTVDPAQQDLWLTVVTPDGQPIVPPVEVSASAGIPMSIAARGDRILIAQRAGPLAPPGTELMISTMTDMGVPVGGANIIACPQEKDVNNQPYTCHGGQVLPGPASAFRLMLLMSSPFIGAGGLIYSLQQANLDHDGVLTSLGAFSDAGMYQSKLAVRADDTVDTVSQHIKPAGGCNICSSGVDGTHIATDGKQLGFGVAPGNWWQAESNPAVTTDGVQGLMAWSVADFNTGANQAVAYARVPPVATLATVPGVQTPLLAAIDQSEGATTYFDAVSYYLSRYTDSGVALTIGAPCTLPWRPGFLYAVDANSVAVADYTGEVLLVTLPP